LEFVQVDLVIEVYYIYAWRLDTSAAQVGPSEKFKRLPTTRFQPVREHTGWTEAGDAAKINEVLRRKEYGGFK
jgi:hypothetical protein